MPNRRPHLLEMSLLALVGIRSVSEFAARSCFPGFCDVALVAFVAACNTGAENNKCETNREIPSRLTNHDMRQDYAVCLAVQI
jgi:hypothetical protein